MSEVNEFVSVRELIDWISKKGFLSTNQCSKYALLDQLERIIDRCINAENDRYNLQRSNEDAQRAINAQRMRCEDLASRLNRVGLCPNAAVVELAAANSRIAHLEDTLASTLAECKSHSRRILELEKENSVMRNTVRECSEARCKAESEARMSTEHAANYHTQLHNIRCAMEAKGFPPNIDIASFIRDRLVCKESTK